MAKGTGKKRSQSRRRSREMALQALYQMDLTGMTPEEALWSYFDSFDSPVAARAFTEQLVRGVCQNRSEVDGLIDSAARNWRVVRMPLVDRNILRIALYEILYCADIPARVSINEAIDLGKRFGSEGSRSFINGVLDHLYRELRRKGRVEEDEAVET